MCRYLLKVNRKTCKLALYGELGRFLLYIDIIMFMVKYWCQIYQEFKKKRKKKEKKKKRRISEAYSINWFHSMIKYTLYM
jgi:hypothetical protein